MTGRNHSPSSGTSLTLSPFALFVSKARFIFVPRFIYDIDGITAIVFVHRLSETICLCLKIRGAALLVASFQYIHEFQAVHD